MKTTTDKLISRRKAAELISVSPRTIARYETQGLLTPLKLTSRTIRYYVCDVQKLISNAAAK